jgi:hypothetical protein
MGANIWFWLIYVLVGIFGGFSMNPWRTQQYAWGFFGSYLVLFILIGILGLHDFGSPIQGGR